MQDAIDEAVDPITGNINWECPCMGENPTGICGELFKSAFRCYVKHYQNQADDGLPLECITSFQRLTECQESHPQLNVTEVTPESEDCGLCPEQDMMERFNKLSSKVSSDQLGQSTWTLLHTMAMYYPMIPTETEEHSMVSFITGLSLFYPCKTCSDHIKTYIIDHPPTTQSANRLSEWFCDLHNDVNRRLGKSQFNFADVQQRWGKK